MNPLSRGHTSGVEIIVNVATINVILVHQLLPNLDMVIESGQDAESVCYSLETKAFSPLVQ